MFQLFSQQLDKLAHLLAGRDVDEAHAEGDKEEDGLEGEQVVVEEAGGSVDVLDHRVHDAHKDGHLEERERRGKA